MKKILCDVWEITTKKNFFFTYKCYNLLTGSHCICKVKNPQQIMFHFSRGRWSTNACCSQSTKTKKTKCPKIQHVIPDSANNFTKSFEIYNLKIRIHVTCTSLRQTNPQHILLWCSFELEDDAVFTAKTVFCEDPIFQLPRHVNPYPTAFPYGNGMVLHFYQQQESSTTKTVHKVINKRLKTYV